MKALTREEAPHGLKIAPLIDIVFLLLIFFLVATTFAEAEKDILIKLAEASEGKEREKSTRILVVNVRKSGVIVINQRVKTMDQLEKLVISAKEQNPDLVVVVRCDRNAYHKHFVRILNMCEKVGVTGVAVATFQEED